MAQKPKSSPKGRSKSTPKPPPRQGPSAAAAQASFFSVLSEFLSLLRTRNPNLRAAVPLPPGKVGPELPLSKPVFGRLITAAAMQDNQGSVIWTKDESELQVITGKVTVELSDGLILVNIPVTCDQAGSATVQVPFAVGGPTSPAGMLVATEEHPRGPDAIIAVWSDALLAFAWKLLMSVATRSAAAAGTDTDGAGLIPAALTANADGVNVLTMARQAFDRVAS